MWRYLILATLLSSKINLNTKNWARILRHSPICDEWRISGSTDRRVTKLRIEQSIEQNNCEKTAKINFHF